MKKTLSALLCLVLVFSMLGALTSCFESEPPVDYNERASMASFPIFEDWLTYSYNADGKPLAVFLADSTLQAARKHPFVRYIYNEEGALSSLALLWDSGIVSLPVSYDAAGAPISASASVDGKSLAVSLTSENGVITRESYSLAGNAFAEASYSADGKPLKLVKYENGEVVTQLDYTVAAESIAVAYLSEGETISSLFSLNENGRPTSMTASVTAGESVGVSITGEWKYAGNYCESLGMTVLADGFETISEHVYEYGGASARVKTTVTRESYEEQRLVAKVVEEYLYSLDGMMTSRADRAYEGVIIHGEQKRIYNEYGVTTEIHMTQFDTAGKKTYTAEYVLITEEKFSKILESFFDANGNKTSVQITDYTYNNSGKCVKEEQTLYDADNRAKTKIIVDYDAYGNVLLREEITYTYLGTVLLGTSYTKYDGNGNVIDSGVRK